MRSLSTVLLAHVAFAEGIASESSANPIRRVVTLLQTMQTRVTEEGKRDAEMYKKFACYCTTGAGDLSRSIGAAEAKMPKVTSALKSAKAKNKQLTSDLTSHTGDRTDAKEALAQAVALRKKEAATFAKDSSDTSTNIKALGGAIAAISKGSGAGFLQTSTASVVRRLTIDMEMSGADRDRLSAFLAVDQSSSADGSYAPASGEILGILKQMKDTMSDELTALEKGEKDSIAAFEGLSAAKSKEIAITTKAIEVKTARQGRVGVDIENIREDLQDTAASYEQDQMFLSDLDTNCGTKKREWEVVQQTRADELVALADTIRILNDDDALELFKSTLPNPSLLQAMVTTREVRGRALATLSVAEGRMDPRLDLIALAIRGRKVSFAKVLTMIEEMTSILKREQVDDDAKKIFCEGRLDKTEDKLKELGQSIQDLTKTATQTEADIETLKDEIAALLGGISALDKSVADATGTRKEESAVYKSTMASDAAAKELLKIARNRMYQFYNPKLYKAPARKEISAEQRVAVSMGSEDAPTDAPSGIAGTGVVASFAQVSQHSHRARDDAAPPPPPEAVAPYQKKGQASAGVLTMMDMLLADLDKEMTEMDTEEKDSQAEYEKYMSDSSAKRRRDSKSLEQKEAMKADNEAFLQKTNAETKSTKTEAYQTAVVLKDLHLECDWLISNFEARKSARAGELDSLANAKAVLSGADYALMQMSVRRS